MPPFALFALAVLGLVMLWPKSGGLGNEPHDEGDDDVTTEARNGVENGAPAANEPGSTMLAKNFALSEFLTTGGRDIKLTPSVDQLRRLRVLAAGLQKVRDAIAKANPGKNLPLRITSGLRNDALSRAIAAAGHKPAKNSRHLWGEAADIVPPTGWNSVALGDVVASTLEDYDQCISYAPEDGGHIHVTYCPGRSSRRERLYIVNGATLRGEAGRTACLKAFQ